MQEWRFSSQAYGPEGSVKTLGGEGGGGGGGAVCRTSVCVFGVKLLYSHTPLPETDVWWGGTLKH